MHILFTVTLLLLLAVVILLFLFFATTFSVPIQRVFYNNTGFQSIEVTPTQFQQVLSTPIYSDSEFFKQVGTLRQISEYFKTEGNNYDGTIVRHYSFGDGDALSSVNKVKVTTDNILTYIPPFEDQQNCYVFDATGDYAVAKTKTISIFQNTPTMAAATFYTIMK